MNNYYKLSTYNPYVRRNTRTESIANTQRDDEIRRRRAAGETRKQLARAYGLSPERIADIVRRGPSQSQLTGVPVNKSGKQAKRGLWFHDMSAVNADHTSRDL